MKNPFRRRPEPDVAGGVEALLDDLDVPAAPIRIREPEIVDLPPAYEGDYDRLQTDILDGQTVTRYYKDGKIVAQR